jgi:hypothetical protein
MVSLIESSLLWQQALEVILKIIDEITIPALRAGMVISPTIFGMASAVRDGTRRGGDDCTL